MNIADEQQVTDTQKEQCRGKHLWNIIHRFGVGAYTINNGPDASNLKETGITGITWEVMLERSIDRLYGTNVL